MKAFNGTHLHLFSLSLGALNHCVPHHKKKAILWNHNNSLADLHRQSNNSQNDTKTLLVFSLYSKQAKVHIIRSCVGSYIYQYNILSDVGKEILLTFFWCWGKHTNFPPLHDGHKEECKNLKEGLIMHFSGQIITFYIWHIPTKNTIGSSI